METRWQDQLVLQTNQPTVDSLNLRGCPVMWVFLRVLSECSLISHHLTHYELACLIGRLPIGLITDLVVLGMRHWTTDLVVLRVRHWTTYLLVLRVRRWTTDRVDLRMRHWTTDLVVLWVRHWTTYLLVLRVRRWTTDRVILRVRRWTTDRVVLRVRRWTTDLLVLRVRRWTTYLLVLRVRRWTTDRVILRVRHWTTDRVVLWVRHWTTDRVVLRVRHWTTDLMVLWVRRWTTDRMVLMTTDLMVLRTTEQWFITSGCLLSLIPPHHLLAQLIVTNLHNGGLKTIFTTFLLDIHDTCSKPRFLMSGTLIFSHSSQNMTYFVTKFGMRKFCVVCPNSTYNFRTIGLQLQILSYSAHCKYYWQDNLKSTILIGMFWNVNRCWGKLRN